jgi:hypothetical protein
MRRDGELVYVFAVFLWVGPLCFNELMVAKELVAFESFPLSPACMNKQARV